MTTDPDLQGDSIRFTGIDHLVLTVEDVEATCRFYEAIGAERVGFGEGRTALRFGEQKINVHPVENDNDLVAEEPTVGGGDFCLLTDEPITEVQRKLEEHGISVVEGPVVRAGAVGQITSVYVRDPDRNLVEIGTYDNDR